MQNTVGSVKPNASRNCAMSASSKFDLSSASPDKAYASGLRGSYGVPSVDRSASFRENVENPILSSLPSMTRNSSPVTQGDVLNFFQCVRFDPKTMVADHKLNRPDEFSRLANAAVGVSVEECLPSSSKSKQSTSSSVDDLRRLKSGVRESGTKARERVKILNDCLSVINKCFPTIPSKKRSRLDALSSDRPYSASPIDRSAAGVGSGKMGTPNHASTSSLDQETQKYEEGSKNLVRNKRPRTSVNDSRMDARVNARPSGTLIKNSDAVRLGGVVQEQDRNLSIAVDGWEKSKMKKRRTGIKPDTGASSMSAKPVGGYMESKHGLQPRIASESRSGLTDSHGFRTGITNGSVITGKAEATSQTSSGMRSSISRTDSENSSLLQDRRERPGGQEKERLNLKAVDKANSREDLSSGSPTSGPKLNGNARAPRSSSSIGGVSKLSQRSSPSNDWELSNCTSKVPAANNRKRTPSARSSSPPVGMVQRPQKNSRTAKRTNLLPVFPANDENAAVVKDRHFPAHSPQQVKIKCDNFSPAPLSESEESGAAEVNLTDKSKTLDKIDGQNLQKTSTMLLPPRKKKNGEGHGDGVRRQGRTGRGSSSSRSLLPLTREKLGNVGTTKQVRSSRLGGDKTESKLGRPPTRKLSDRKAYTRQKHVAVSMTSDFLVGCDIGHEELLAASNAVTNTVQALSSPFWKMMEGLFRFISDKDISYLKNQMNLGSIDTLAPVPVDANSSTLLPNGYDSNEFGREESEARSAEPNSDHIMPGTKTPDENSLYQRLMSAIVTEEELTECENSYENYESQLEIENNYELDHSMLDTSTMHDKSCSEYWYQNMSMNEKLLLEINSIGIYPDLGTGDDEINQSIRQLEEKYQEKVSKKKSLLGNLISSASEAKELQERVFEGLSLEKLVGMAYDKYMSFRRPNSHGVKSASGKMARQVALAFVKRVLERCREFETTGKSCFDEPLYKDSFFSRVARLSEEPMNVNIENDSARIQRSSSAYITEVRTPAQVGPQQSPINILDMYSSEALLDNVGPNQKNGIVGIWPRRELLLDDVGGIMSTATGVPSGLGGSLSCNTKGKRSDRDREGKGNRQVSSRSGTGKIGRPSTSSAKGERKSKAKPKLKNVNLSSSFGMPGQPKVVTSAVISSELDMLEDPIDLSGLQIPEMDDIGGQGEDIGSWLNIEDDGLPLQDDEEFMGGLQIPMDDLSDLNMML